MCTSFVFRGAETVIGMNFDSNGMAFGVNAKQPGRFMVAVDGGRGKWPSFGVRSDGTFVNNLCVDSNGKGNYRRPSAKVTHTSKIVADVLDGALAPEQIGEYLKTVEVVNTPDWSTHNMIVLPNGDVYIAEPGHGVLYSPKEEAPFFVMTNFSLLDARENGFAAGDGAERYRAVTGLLTGVKSLRVSEAFSVLDAAKQETGEWRTVFSMVYCKSEQAVYFCRDREWGKLERHVF